MNPVVVDITNMISINFITSFTLMLFLQVVVVGLATDYCVGSTALHSLQQVSVFVFVFVFVFVSVLVFGNPSPTID